MNSRANPLAIAADVLNVAEAQLRAERIKGGLTNESWCVTSAQGDVVVRVSTADERALQLDRQSEERVLSLVDTAGIGADVLLCAPARRVLVTRRLNAQTLDANSLRQSHVIHAVAALLRQLHVLPAPVEVQRIELMRALHGYAHSVQQAGGMLNDSDLAHAYEVAAESSRASAHCLCHNDVHHLNLLSDGQRYWLVDWEYAGIGDPLFDLASVCVYHHFDQTLRDELLQAYRGEVSEREAQRLERMCWLFDYIKTLWLQVRELSEGRLG
jgi:thiamine kinase